MYTIKKALEDLERTMIKNIANSLFQIYFHQTASPEELQRYYGWKEEFNEKERDELVQDTVKRVQVEQQILKFYQDKKHLIIKTYGQKNPTGDLDLPVQQPAGDSTIEGSTDQSTKTSTEGQGSGSTPEHGGDEHAVNLGGNDDAKIN